jgi:hypothetical protein
MKRQNVNEKLVRPPYRKILPETIRERFNLLDLPTDFFDPWCLECRLSQASTIVPASENRPDTKRIDWAKDLIDRHLPGPSTGRGAGRRD